jgi:hypothetical protein
MRQFTIGILCGAAFFALTSCNKSPQGQASEPANAGGEASPAATDYFTVRAGPVANAKVTALSGTFQMLKVSAAQGIPSNGVGGACIVFAAADLGYPVMASRSCTTNLSCQTGENGNDGKPASAFYCHQATHTCWARPGSDPFGNATCNRPITMTPAVLNPVPPDPPGAGPVDATKLGIKPGAKTRVVACLNKGQPPYPPPGPGCRQIDSNDRIEDFGPIATVKP